jgi:ATP/ADP translocase
VRIAVPDLQSNLYKIFEALFGVKHGEFRIVQAFFFYFVLIGIYATIGANAGDILFLARLDSARVESLLPWIYMGIAASAILITMVYESIKDRFSRTGLMVGLQLVMAAALAGGRFLVPLNSEGIYIGVCIAIEAFSLLAFTMFFSLAGDYFTSRDARRVYGYITGGVALGFFIGGSLTEPLASFIGTENLLLVCAALLTSFAMMVMYISRSFTLLADAEQQDAGESFQGGAPFSQMFKNPYLLVIFSVVMLAGIAEILIDYNFKVLAASVYDEEQLAAFFGSFWSRLGLVSLFVQFLLVGWLLRNRGVISSLLILPFLLIITCYSMTVVPSLALATISAFIFFTLFEALNTPAQELLFLPLDTRMRHRAQEFCGGGLASFGLGLGGLALLILNHYHLSVSHVALAAGVTVTLQFLLTFFLGPRYRQLLENSLQRLSLKPADLEAFLLRIEDTSVFADILRSKTDSTVLTALDLVAMKPHNKYLPIISALAGSASEKVAARAVAILEDGQTDVIEKALADTRPAVRQAALRAWCRLKRENAFAQAVAALAEPLLFDTALFCLVSYCGFPGALIAYPQIDAMLKSDSDDERFRVARLLPEIEVPGTGTVLKRLLNDSCHRVRIEALKAAAKSSDPLLIYELIENLSDFDARPLAIKAVDALSVHTDGEAIIATLSQDYPYSVRAVLLRSLEYSRADLRGHIWNSFISSDDIRMKIVAANIFKRLRLKGGRPDFVPDGFDEEIDNIVSGAKLVYDAAMEGGSCSVILHDHARLMVEMLISLLCVKYDAVQLQRVESYLFGSNETLRANAGELLELILPKQTARQIVELALVEFSCKGEELSDSTLKSLAAIDSWCASIAKYSFCLGENGGIMQDSEVYRLMSNISILKQVDIFRDIPADYLMTVAAIAVEHTLYSGELLFSQGDAGDALYVICEGEISIRSGEVEKAKLGSNTYIGEMALLDDQPRSASAIALTETRLIRIAGNDFRNLLGSHPRITMTLLSALARRLRETMNAQQAERHA